LTSLATLPLQGTVSRGAVVAQSIHPSAEVANAMLAPDLGRARGRPVSFLPSKTRGVTRREDALSGSRRTARTIIPGGPGSPDPGASADASRQLGATRHLPLSRSRPVGPLPGVLVLPGATRCRPRRRLTLSRPGAASRPTFTTPHESAPQRTGR